MGGGCQGGQGRTGRVAREVSAGPAESEQTSCFEVKARRIGLVDGFPSLGGGGVGGNMCSEFSTRINAGDDNL